jgi:hypothetical protein
VALLKIDWSLGELWKFVKRFDFWLNFALNAVRSFQIEQKRWVLGRRLTDSQ